MSEPMIVVTAAPSRGPYVASFSQNWLRVEVDGATEREAIARARSVSRAMRELEERENPLVIAGQALDAVEQHFSKRLDTLPPATAADTTPPPPDCPEPWVVPGATVWYSPGGCRDFAGVVASEPIRLGDNGDWVVRLEEMDPGYGSHHHTDGRTHVTAAALFALTPRYQPGPRERETVSELPPPRSDDDDEDEAAQDTSQLTTTSVVVKETRMNSENARRDQTRDEFVRETALSLMFRSFGGDGVAANEMAHYVDSALSLAKKLADETGMKEPTDKPDTSKAESKHSFPLHPCQVPPADDDEWRTWLFYAGKGAGKTTGAAEWVVSRAQEGYENIAIVSLPDMFDDVRAKIVDSSTRHGLHVEDRASRREMFWPHGLRGRRARLYSAKEPETLRGPQFDTAWCEEILVWPAMQTTLDNVQFATRLSGKPRMVITATVPNAIDSILSHPLTRASARPVAGR